MICGVFIEEEGCRHRIALTHFICLALVILIYQANGGVFYPFVTNPTPKRVKDLLIFPTQMTAVQNSAARNLKRYVGECDDPTLRSFLRFCTGADVLFGHRIKVEFIQKSDFQCCPRVGAS
ncbi:hypothetical protein N1851_005775 [Merluccius polli]|uniref:Uncharacterized protein n=1 Tax=Merluccius polli TaxID=89951 RepID=A0AA47P9Y7_MERPO|nr:hypothetical protein N1851_005775 [Merluccius polli]